MQRHIRLFSVILGMPGMLGGCTHADPNALVGASRADALACMGKPTEIAHETPGDFWIYLPPKPDAPQNLVMTESCQDSKMGHDPCIQHYTTGREGAVIAPHMQLPVATRCSVVLGVAGDQVHSVGFVAPNGTVATAEQCQVDVPRCPKLGGSAK